jgi:hypothetical protein
VRSLVTSMVRGRAAAIAIALLMSATVAGTAGCAAVRSGLGTSSSVCFRAIPVGRGAVTPPPSTAPSSNGQSSGKPVQTTFVGVRSATQKDIDTFGSAHNYLRSELTMRNGGPLKSLCLVAFHGSFDPTSVLRAVQQAACNLLEIEGADQLHALCSRWLSNRRLSRRRLGRRRLGRGRPA